VICIASHGGKWPEPDLCGGFSQRWRPSGAGQNPGDGMQWSDATDRRETAESSVAAGSRPARRSKTPSLLLKTANRLFTRPASVSVGAVDQSASMELNMPSRISAVVNTADQALDLLMRTAFREVCSTAGDISYSETAVYFSRGQQHGGIVSVPDDDSPLDIQAASDLTNRRLGAEIRRIRMQRNMTLTDIATETGLSASMLSMVERGKTGVSVGSLVAVASALGVAVSDLFQPSTTPELSLVR
jgi:DNA-binding Xre family transcriptional regulator